MTWFDSYAKEARKKAAQEYLEAMKLEKKIAGLMIMTSGIMIFLGFALNDWHLSVGGVFAFAVVDPIWRK